LKRQVSRLDEPRTKLFHEMLTYHRVGQVRERVRRQQGSAFDH
jgi:hypothetical protein